MYNKIEKGIVPTEIEIIEIVFITNSPFFYSYLLVEDDGVEPSDNLFAPGLLAESIGFEPITTFVVLLKTKTPRPVLLPLS